MRHVKSRRRCGSRPVRSRLSQACMHALTWNCRLSALITCRPQMWQVAPSRRFSDASSRLSPFSSSSMVAQRFSNSTSTSASVRATASSRSSSTPSPAIIAARLSRKPPSSSSSLAFSRALCCICSRITARTFATRFLSRSRLVAMRLISASGPSIRSRCTKSPSGTSRGQHVFMCATSAAPLPNTRGSGTTSALALTARRRSSAHLGQDSTPSREKSASAAWLNLTSSPFAASAAATPAARAARFSSSVSILVVPSSKRPRVSAPSAK